MQDFQCTIHPLLDIIAFVDEFVSSALSVLSLAMLLRNTAQSIERFLKNVMTLTMKLLIFPYIRAKIQSAELADGDCTVVRDVGGDCSLPPFGQLVITPGSEQLLSCSIKSNRMGQMWVSGLERFRVFLHALNVLQ